MREYYVVKYRIVGQGDNTPDYQDTIYATDANNAKKLFNLDLIFNCYKPSEHIIKSITKKVTNETD